MSDEGKKMTVTKDEQQDSTIKDVEEIKRKYLLTYNTGHVKIQDVLFPDTFDQVAMGTITHLIELTENLLYRGDDKWVKIPNVEYKVTNGINKETKST